MQTENIHLLLVEDNPGFLEELIEWLKDFGYQNLETATNVNEAITKLQNPFDVIISDMRMEADDSGFAILDQVQSLNLSSVVIILTANDTVNDCRNSFKKGAWDYISKNMKGNVFDVLHQSIQEAITYFNRWGNVKNDQWIEENLQQLEQDYWGQYIAVINKMVIEIADSEESLKRKIEERKLRRFLTTIRKIGASKSVSELIKQGESSTVEYKSTLQWDINKNCKNEDLRFSVLKTIVAFLNSEGGILLIGVEDNGNIFGLDQDIALLSKKSLDQFEQTLINIIINNIGVSFTQNIKIAFETLEEKQVCMIDVKKSSKKAFLKSNKGLEFYVRAGNTSRSLNIPDIYDHF
jgi:CheY-like chemotaxis protein